MATTREKWQEIANRGLQDRFDPETRARFDEAVNRGLITFEDKDPLIELQNLLARQAKGEEGLGESIQQLRESTVQLDQGGDASQFGRLDAEPQGFLGSVGQGFEQGAADIGTGLITLFNELRVSLGDEGAQEVIDRVQQANVNRQIETNIQTAEHPVGKFIGEVAGGAVALPLPLAKGATALSTIGKSAGLGVAGGVTQAAGTEQDRVISGLAGGLIGGGIGAVAPPIAKGIGKAGQGIKTFFTGKSPTKNKIVELIEQRAGDKAAAGFELRPPSAIEKAFGGAGKRLTSSPVQQEAIKQGVDKGVVSTVAASTGPDTVKMRKMLNIMKRGKENARFALFNRPSDVAGDTLLERFKFVKDVNRKAGQQLDKVAKDLKGKPLDQSVPVNQFMDDLGEIGVKLDKDLNPIFRDSDIEGSTGAENVIKKIVKRMRDTKAPDAHDAHRLKKFIDEHVTFGKTTEGLTGKTERILKDLRRSLDDNLDKAFPEYNKVNTTYAETIGAINSLQDVAGRKIDLTGKNANKAAGTKLRGLMSNIQSRANLMNAVEDIEKVAVNNGGKFDDDIFSQVLFADELDNVFGPVARTSFQGQIKQGVTDISDIPISKSGAAIKAGDFILNKFKGDKEQAAFKAIEQLLGK